VKQLIADICLPLRLNELGVRDEHQLSMAGQAYQRSPHLANATLLSRDDTEAISVWRSSRATAASAAICLLQNLEG
jgi:alcohol dehydrogenase class IV